MKNINQSRETEHLFAVKQENKTDKIKRQKKVMALASDILRKSAIRKMCGVVGEC